MLFLLGLFAFGLVGVLRLVLARLRPRPPRLGALARQLERGQQMMHELGEAALTLDRAGELVEIGAGPLLDPGAPEIDDVLRRAAAARGRSAARRAISASASSSGASSRLVDVGKARALVAVVEHGADIGGDARHAPRADQFDPRLLERVEHGARLEAGGLQTAMDRRRRGRRDARRSKSAWPRTIAASCAVSLRGGSGRRALALSVARRAGRRAPARTRPRAPASWPWRASRRRRRA